jgi:hypothetical protein
MHAPATHVRIRTLSPQGSQLTAWLTLHHTEPPPLPPAPSGINRGPPGEADKYVTGSSTTTTTTTAGSITSGNTRKSNSAASAAAGAGLLAAAAAAVLAM